MVRVLIQYLLQPIPFVLTVILPIASFLIDRRYAWFSLLLTVGIELLINWDNFCYYESRDLMIMVTLAQIIVMIGILLILSAVIPKRK